MIWKLFLIALPVFLVIDLLWLGVVARGLYRRFLGSHMTSKVNWPAAIAFYVLFVVGLVAFVIDPAVEASSWQHAAWWGALYGLVTYATYDLTNLATLRDWPLPITFIDLIWGTALAASVATVTYALADALNV